MWLNSQSVNALDDAGNDQTYMTLGRIIDMRVDPALEKILLFSSDYLTQNQPRHITLKYSGSVCGSFSNLERWISKKLLQASDRL